MVKSHLFRLLRAKLSENWVKYLSNVTQNLNLRPLKRIGNLRPIDIQSRYDNIAVQEMQKKEGLLPYQEPGKRIFFRFDFV